MAESVFIAGMFVMIGREYEELCRRTGQTAEADYAHDEIEKMYKATLDAGWDGAWFVRAYDAFGKKMVPTNAKTARSLSKATASA